MRSPINIVGGFYKDPNKHWSAQDTLNWIPVKSERSGTRTEWQFRDAPGVKPLVKLGVNSGGDFIEAGPGRGLRNVEGKLFAVAGNTLFQITNDLVSIPYGTIPGVNRVSMAHNQYGSANQLLTVNGSAGYVFNTSSLVFEKITDTGYPGAFVADYVDGYLAQVESLGRYWFHSDLAEAREYNTFDQYEAEGDPDRIVTLHVAYREVLLFGVDTIEPYVNAPRGPGIAPFQRAANTVIQCGCSAKFSPRNIAGVVPFLDDKRVVQYLQGYSVNRISTVGIEQALGECSREEISNAYAYTYEDRGHKIYYLTVPGRFTFGYDFLTQEWHRRATSGLPDLAFTDVAFWNGMWVALDRRYGRLYELDWGYKLDSCEPLVRERVTGVLSNNQNRVTVNELELLFNVGTEISVCQPFEEQPEGPTISGDAPDGGLEVAWGPYAYTFGGGTAPLKLSIRPGGTLPPGIGPLNPTTGTIAAGTPETLGTYPFTVRVTDANGLYADVEDQIIIGVPVFGSSGSLVYVSQTGNTWDSGDNFNPPGVATPGLLKFVNGRLYMFQIDGTFAQYTEDAGQTYTTVTGLPADGVNDIIWTGDEYLCFTQLGGCYFSADGVAFASRTIPAGNCLGGAIREETIIVGSNGESVYKSTDNGLTFTKDSVPGLVSLATVRITLDIGDRFAIFAAGSGAGGRCATSVDGAAWTIQSGWPGELNAIGAAYSPALDRIVVIMALGQSYYSDDKGVTWIMGDMVADNGFNTPSMLVCVNDIFVFGATGGEIWNSPDGITWAKALDLSGNPFNSISRAQ